MLRGHSAHEHPRTRASLSPRLAGPGRQDGVGLAAVSVLWGHPDRQVGPLRAPPVDAGGATDGACPAAPLRAVPADVLRALAVAGARELVRTGGAALHARSPAARGQFGAPQRRSGALAAGQARAMAPLAAAGPSTQRRPSVPSERGPGPALGGPGGGGGPTDGRGAVGGGAPLGATGDRWAVGPPAGERQGRAAGAGRPGDRRAMAPGDRDRRGVPTAVGAAVPAGAGGRPGHAPGERDRQRRRCEAMDWRPTGGRSCPGSATSAASSLCGAGWRAPLPRRWRWRPLD